MDKNDCEKFKIFLFGVVKFQSWDIFLGKIMLSFLKVKMISKHHAFLEKYLIKTVVYILFYWLYSFVIVTKINFS